MDPRLIEFLARIGNQLLGMGGELQAVGSFILKALVSALYH